MTGLLDYLKGPMGQILVKGIANETGQPADRTGNVLRMAIPLFLGAMQRNASTEEGAQSLMNAFTSKHDGGMLDKLGDFFQGGVDPNEVEDGAGILGHVFGDNQGKVEQALGSKSGMDAGAVANILKIAAPVIMGTIGRERRHDAVEANGLNSLLGGMLGGEPEQNKTIFQRLLDADGDGDVLDDIAGKVMGDNEGGGGLGNLLGGLFK